MSISGASLSLSRARSGGSLWSLWSLFSLSLVSVIAVREAGDAPWAKFGNWGQQPRTGDDMIVSDSMVLSRTRFVCYHFVECFNGYAGGIHDSE